jgi:hypothetical protein
MTLRGAPLPMIRDFSHGTRPTTNPLIWPEKVINIRQDSTQSCELRSLNVDTAKCGEGSNVLQRLLVGPSTPR